ncbi:ribosome recycling factor [Hypoxylon sp. NC1633]|nr:ribosome recycling factor [Hypoxylon sp. NC1633]
MRHTAAKALSWRSLARPELGRINHHEVVRPSFRANSSLTSQHARPVPPSTSGTSRVLLLDSPRAFSACKATRRERSPEWKGGRLDPKIRAEQNKRKQEARDKRQAEEEGEAHGLKHPAPDPEEPLDFADVTSRLRHYDERFREALRRLRTGGRFNPDVVGGVRVTPDRKNAPETTYPLREIAQIVPRGGRIISLIVHEEAYVRPVMSAVQASPDFNQQPQRDPDNELELLLKIEPERPEDAVRRAKALCHDWREKVRLVRHRRDKQHVTWRKERVIGPDVQRAADKELDKILKAKMSEIDDAEKEAVKTAEASR